MSWWSWVIAGAILLGAELAVVDAQFYLVFIGAAGLLTGLVTVLAPGLAPAAQWLLFGALAIVSMVAFRARIYALVRGNTPSVRTGPVGATLTLPQALAPGESCQVEHGGSFWTARNTGAAAIPAGAQVRVSGVHGLTLNVHAESSTTHNG
jgi:membrane protein implicated in regulation of membrane protease activity